MKHLCERCDEYAARWRAESDDGDVYLLCDYCQDTWPSHGWEFHLMRRDDDT